MVQCYAHSFHQSIIPGDFTCVWCVPIIHICVCVCVVDRLTKSRPDMIFTLAASSISKNISPDDRRRHCR